MAEENYGIYFKELTLKNVRCFGEEAILKLSNDKGEWTKWNVILGENGTGKTTLLQCLAGMELTLLEEPVTNDINLEKKGIDFLEDRASENKPKEWSPKLFLNDKIFFYPLKLNIKNDDKRQEFLETPVLIRANIVDKATSKEIVIGYGHYNAIWRLNWRVSTEIESFSNLFIIGYGANRRISFQILSEKETEPENSETLFDVDSKLINTEEWLLQMEFAASRDSEIREIAIKRRDLIIGSLKEILPDISEIRFKDSTNIEKPVPRLEFKTPYGWVGMGELSYGYETMVAWIVDVAARMFKKYPNSVNPLEEPVIILVDEIDLHLHPKWQRQIFDFLEARFPRAQFIVTAHSPLIVQSAPRDANIIVLKKQKVDNEFVVKIDNDIESVRNWRIDQIMASDLFGLESARNYDIEKQLTERNNLLKKNDLNKEEKERLEELNRVAHNLPTAENKGDIEAMEIIRKTADYLKSQQKKI